MKNFLTICLMLLSTAAMFGQGSISGVVVDADTKDPLIGATILVEGTLSGTVTDFDGAFTLNDIQDGDQVLVISYTGYSTMKKSISKGMSDLGAIELNTETIGLQSVEVIASVAQDRKTPIAVTTISGDKIEALVGNQEYPEILRRTPSVYVTKQGGGFGDARINVRGFDQSNTAVMINGIPVNDMENGWVYWSNWAGLSDVTSKLQIQRGLGASKLAVASVGGSINIITNAADFDKGGAAGVTFGNDGYQKYSMVLSSGLQDNGWAFTFQGTHTRGDGYVNGTKFRAYSYFLSTTKIINTSHSLSFTALGAPQWHHQRNMPGSFDGITLRTFEDPDDPNNEDASTGRGYKYNWLSGTLDGEEFTWRRNFYHKPKAFINHYWTITPKTELKTSAYVSLGRGGGTGPRGRINAEDGSRYYDTSSAYRDENGEVRFDDIVAFNQGQVGLSTFAPWEEGDVFTSEDATNGKYTTSSSDGLIRRASMNSHNWYGVLSTLTTELNDNLDFVAGVDGRLYKGIHYRRVENLLGSDSYLSRSDDSFPENYISDTAPADFGSFADDTHDPGNNVLAYYNDGLVNWLGLFTQLEYSNDKTTAFVSLSGSNQGFKRVDYFNYEEKDTPDNDINDDGEYRESDWENFLGGTVKVGLNYNINDQHNVFVNGGYFSRQPNFDNVFVNFRNEVNPDASNQAVTSFEAGYGFRAQNFTAKVNGYYTKWGNRQFDQGFDDFQYIFNGDTLVVDALALFSGVEQVHTGLEFELNYSPLRNLSFDAMLSIGDWSYTKDFNATITDTDNGRQIGEATLATNGLKIGDAAQTTFSVGANWEIIKGLKLNASYYMADNLYAQWNIQDGIPDEVAQLPSYDLVDAGLSYNFDLGGSNCTIRFNGNNLLDNVYISELTTSIVDDPTTTDVNEFYDNRGIFGFGRTWNAGFKVRF